MIEIPRMSRAWHALGHAIAAAQRFEMVLRVANMEIAVRRLQRMSRRPVDAERALAKISENVSKGTLGPVVDRFTNEYKDALGEEGVKEFRIAVEARNYLTHHFLVPNIQHLFSDDSLNLVVAECQWHMSNFEHLVQVAIFASKVDVAKFVAKFAEPTE